MEEKIEDWILKLNVKMVSSLKFHDELLTLNGKGVMVSRIISRLTPAPLINLYVGIILSLTSPIGLGPVLDYLSSILICVIVMVILPVVPILYEAWKGKVDLDVSERESRVKFLLFSMFCYVIAFVIYWFFDCLIMSSLSAAYFTVASGVLLVSLKYKISVHGAGVGGPGEALIYTYGLIALIVVIVWIFVIYSRIVLKQHTLGQAVAGVMLGAVITWTTYFFLYLP